MTLNCSVSSSAPATTNVVMAYVNSNNVYLDLSTASTEDVKTVNDFVSVIGNHITVNILDYNGPDYFEANIIVPGETDAEEISIEYSSLTTAKKTKVTKFVDLISSLVQIN